MNSLITNWNNLLQSNSTVDMFESAFFRIYIEYENLMSDTFIKFSLGTGCGTYTPLMKLNFSDERQLRELIKGDGSGAFIDFTKAIDRCSPHIFHKDPFETLKSSVNFSDDLLKMKVIRNYLAHRSAESKEKYIRSVLTPMNITSYIEPGAYLQLKVKNKGFTYYTKYCNVILDVETFLNNDQMLSNL